MRPSATVRLLHRTARQYSTPIRRLATSSAPVRRPQPWLTIGLSLTAFTTVAWFSAPIRTDDGVTAKSGKGKNRERKYRLEEIRQHRTEDSVWVTKGGGVYDVTDWLPSHPGGKIMLNAAGSSVDPWWAIISVHNKQEVHDVLEQYRIGVIDPRDLNEKGEVPMEDVPDPFATDPERDERLRQLSSRPCNAETPVAALEDWITPNELFYVRNHLWVPQISEQDYRLTITRLDGEEVAYDLDTLRKFRPTTITATLQCSGNRRSHMTKGARSTSGLQWNQGAISNAEWTGVLLRDLLLDAGVTEDEM